MLAHHSACIVALTWIACLGIRGQDPKLAIPAAVDQRKAEKVVRELYREDYARITRADRVALAQRLLEAGRGTRNDPTIRYVLLSEAEGMAALHGDLRTAYLAIEELATSHVIDTDAMRTSALGEAKKATTLLEAAIDLTKFLLEKAAEAVAKEAYDEALRWSEDAKGVAKGVRDASLSKEATSYAVDVAEMKKEHAVAKQAQAALETNFDHAESSIVYGKYLAFVRGDWERGLRLVAKGPEGLWKVAAQAEIGATTTPEAGLARGEAWLDIGAKEKGFYKRRVLARARHWLESSYAGATGITRARLDRKLEELDKAEFGPGAINVAKAFNPKLDSVLGEWRTLNGGILTPIPVPGRPERAHLPLLPGEEYDLRILIERPADSQGSGVGIGVVVGPSQLLIRADEGQIGLEEVEGKVVSATKGLPRGQLHSLYVMVRRASVTVRLNGAQVLEWRGDPRKLAPPGMWMVPNTKSLFMMSGGVWHFARIDYLPVTGVGKPLR